ncbi:MAG: VOC family protein [Chloroflexota bacterium]
MNHSYKPDGYNSVAPYLIVEDASSTIEFLIKTFSAVQLRRFTHTDGRIQHAEVCIEDSVIMLADKAEGWPPTPSYVHIYVPDVEDTYRRALDAGAESVQRPQQKDDPDKRGGVKDAGGTTWWIATQME